MLYNHITELIGNTPLLRIDARIHGLRHIDLYAKLENFNPFGSVKDRIAWGMLQEDIAGIAAQGKLIIEASSGNTAKALQAIANTYGVRVKVLTNRVKVAEVKRVLQLLGTEIEEFPGLSECPDPTAPNDIFATIQNLVEAHPARYFSPSQYTNERNIATHYRSTGQEIIADLGAVDYLIGGLGTTGSTRGTGEALKEVNPRLKTIGIVATKQDFIPGIRSIAEMWEVGLFEPDFYETILAVESSDAIDAMMELVKRCGILAGPTSGAAFHGALDYLRAEDARLDSNKVAVFIVCDRIEWYLSYLQKRRPTLFGESEPSGSIRDLSATEIEAAPVVSQDDAWSINLGTGALLIDIRGNMAYRIGHVPGFINIRDDQLDDMIAKGLPFPKSTELIIICPLGEQSKRFVASLTKKGYRAGSLEGGIIAWRDANRPMESTT